MPTYHISTVSVCLAPPTLDLKVLSGLGHFQQLDCFSTAITGLKHFTNDSTEQKELRNFQSRMCFQIQFATGTFSNVETSASSNEII